MRENREPWIVQLLAAEGGFVDDEDDPGGPTALGVTAKTLAAWRDLRGPDGKRRLATSDEVRTVTRDEAREIAWVNYWNPVKGDALSGGIDFYVADCAYHMGPARAARLLQEALILEGQAVEIDGVVGEKTVAATRAIDSAKVLDRLHDLRLAYLRSRKHWAKFGKGWTNRCNDMLVAAKACVVSPVMEAKAPKAAVEGGFIALVVAVITGAAPVLIDSFTAGQKAAEGGDWTLIGGAVAIVAGAAIRGWSRYRAYITASPR